MSIEECPHGDMPYLCPPCQAGFDAPKTKVATADGPVTRAEFDGECPRCDEAYPVGTKIAKASEGWVCCGRDGAALT